MDTIMNISRRAKELEATMPHGIAIKLACAEFNEPFEELGELISVQMFNSENEVDDALDPSRPERKFGESYDDYLASFKAWSANNKL